MSIEFPLPRLETTLLNPPTPPAALAAQPRTWWPLTQAILAGLLLTYLFGMVQDIQRVRDLRAEPSLSAKVVITKYEAWQRIYSRPARTGTR